jgi:hypothetical protein
VNTPKIRRRKTAEKFFLKNVKNCEKARKTEIFAKILQKIARNRPKSDFTYRIGYATIGTTKGATPRMQEKKQ